MPFSPSSCVEIHSSHSARADHHLHSEKAGLHEAFVASPILQRARFLQGLSEYDKGIVLATATSRTYKTDSVIAEQGTPADKLFMLVKGSARYFFITSSGQKMNLFWLAPGDIFGGATLLSEPAHFVVSTEAVKESRVLIWHRDTVRALAVRFPRILENGLAIACDYLVWYLATHLSLVCDSARQRLAHVLISLGRGIGHQNADGISLEITNEQLANTANLTPFTVSRLLSQWQRSGSITKRRGSILLRHPEQLFVQDPPNPLLRRKARSFQQP